MKKFPISLILILITSYCLSQSSIDSKRDYQWVMGASDQPVFNSGGSMLDFNFNPPDTSFNLLAPGFNMYCDNSNICDTSGLFILATNGAQVIGRNNCLLPNGDSLSYGPFTDNWGNHIVRGSMILPLPGSESLYYIFHQNGGYLSCGLAIPELYYSIVDMRLNNGIGKVTAKNMRILNDTLVPSFAACRHANGRDWWLVVPSYNNKSYFICLFTPKGIISVIKQEIGLPTYEPPFFLTFTQCFSLDGSRYVISAKSPDFLNPGGHYWVKVFDFDRCNGILSNVRVYEEQTSKENTYTCVLSPSGKYLYTSNDSLTFQFDLDVPDFGSTKQVVAAYDGYMDSICGSFRPILSGISQLGPDGKIYQDANNTPYLHVIENPDAAGIACNVIQRKIRLPRFTCYAIPYYPNFRLGPLVGSGCDTLNLGGIDKPSTDQAFLQLYPNPANQYLSVQLKGVNSNKNFTVTILNALGKEVLDMNNLHPSEKVNVSKLPDGIYLLTLMLPDHNTLTSRFVVAH
ncbi:MAG: T9SS type A sorting domain-containing protein [Bacteroidetes bacterium]|nr:T9SS type A sorting domain-containing protein [Bacteroidota bacterium]